VQPRGGVTFTAGDGVGVNNSFGGVTGFVPITQQPGRSLTYAEGQVQFSTDRGHPSANLAVGHRVYDQASDRIYGGYLAYDHRSTGRNGFNQIGLGVETLGKVWDVRANAYLPVGNTRQLAGESSSSTVTATSNPFFQGNFLAVNRTIQQQIAQRYEAAGTGFDIEAGGKIANLGSGDLRGYGGLYTYSIPEGDRVVGWRARLEATPTDNVRLGLAVSGDGTFGTNVAFTAALTFPNFRPSRAEVPNPVLARMGESLARNPNIVIADQLKTQSITQQDTALLTNPSTGQPWRFRHANPGIGTGDGSVENPTGTLAGALAVAQADDIVYVQPGSNPGIPSFTIPDGVQVLSTGPVQRIDTVELGNLQLPGSGAGTLPSVLGTVTMGNRSTLSGFGISSPVGPGVLANNVNQVTIRDNAIANTATHGIELTNLSGRSLIQNNSIRQAGLEGIFLQNSQGQVDLTIANNTISDNRANGVAISLENAAQGTVALAQNTILNNQLNGVSLQLSNAANGQFNLDGNTLNTNQFKGFTALFSDDSSGTIRVANSTLSNNLDDGFYLQTSDQARATASLLSSTLSNNGTYGVFTEANGNSQLRFQAGSNTITGNGISGLSINSNGNANTAASLQSNTITSNSLSDVDILTNITGSTCLQPLTNEIGNLFIDDSFGGNIRLETGALPTNTIATSDLANWSGTTVPAGSCGF
jgi:hypothetical protein